MADADVANTGPDYLRLILTSRVYDVVRETPLQPAVSLSQRLQHCVMLKREDMQPPCFSFKIRGAYNRIAHLSAADRARGVVAVSAGNHAQGVALAAAKLGCRATIVMPTCTPAIKVSSVQRLGGQVVLHGEDFDDAKEKCAELVAVHGYVNIPPYDDPYVIAGQGTCAVEIMHQARRLAIERRDSECTGESPSAGDNERTTDDDGVDVIFCAVGGGGLAAGVTAYVKRVFPAVTVIGVETTDANSMYQSLRAGHPVTLDQVGLFAEGAAVRCVGAEPFRLCYGERASGEQKGAVAGLDEVVLVDNDEICAAIKDVFTETRTVLETAGAMGVAGLKKWCAMHGEMRGLRLVAITSGANMNFDRLRFVAERASLGEEREALISAVIPERPGSFLKFYEAIYPRSILEFSYRYGDRDRAQIFASVAVEQRDRDLEQIFALLKDRGMSACDLSHDELAKSHARYLVGGRHKVDDERLLRFSFPERPGALKKFLVALHGAWNVSLFHYRNIGGDIGKVLVGMQVCREQEEEFRQFLETVGYTYTDETDSLVYKQFLR